MAKINIKSEKITPFGGKYPMKEQFSHYVDPVIDEMLGYVAPHSAIGTVRLLKPYRAFTSVAEAVLRT